LADTTLSAVESAVESRLTGFAASGAETLNLIPRIELPAATPKQLAHLGYWVAFPRTVRARRNGRERVRQRVDDTMVVTFLHRINPHNQRAARRSAYDAEGQIRQRLTLRSWSDPLNFRIRHESTTRAVVPGKAEHLAIALTFTVTRETSLGG